MEGHEETIRSMCSGSSGVYTGAQDKMLKRWQLIPGTIAFEQKNTMVDHEHWVTALVALPPGVLEECPSGGVVSGSMDKMIRVYSAEGTLVRQLLGHDHGVISLGWTVTGELISGSWDETARVWDVGDGSVKHVLSGHENGVCVLGLPNGTIATGSTGRQDGDGIAGFQIRLWSSDGNETKSLREHTGAIRCLEVIPDLGFASCSNDGSVRIYSTDGYAMCHLTGHTGFVFQVARLSNGNLVSVSEDATVKVWDGVVCSQTIEHPRGIWCVTALESGDFATGCQDR
jgi:phospholipase A-2-activating protein